MPTVAVRDLVIHPREHDLVVGTHGRGVFVIDDIRPLRALAGSSPDQSLAVFEAPPAIQYSVRQKLVPHASIQKRVAIQHGSRGLDGAARRLNLGI